MFRTTRGKGKKASNLSTGPGKLKKKCDRTAKGWELLPSRAPAFHICVVSVKGVVAAAKKSKRLLGSSINSNKVLR